MVIYNRPDPTQPGWCDSGEAVKPTNVDIAMGWPATQIPPSRQEFNWLDKQQDQGIKYLCRVGIARWDINEEYQGFGFTVGSNGSVYWNLQPCVGIDPVFDNGHVWELTNVRLSDADARYLTISSGASMFLTRQQGDARYTQLTAMGNYLTVNQANLTFLSSVAAAGQYLTRVEAFSTFALRSDLSLFTNDAAAQASYLRIVDAANTYLTQSNAAQTYLTIADADNRFAGLGSGNTNYAQSVANDAATSVRAWVTPFLPSFRREDYGAGGTNACTWLIIRGGITTFEVAVGLGYCQQGDALPIPNGFIVDNFKFHGWISRAIGSGQSGDALLDLNFLINGNIVTNCFYTKSNSGGVQRSRGLCFGEWIGFGYR